MKTRNMNIPAADGSLIRVRLRDQEAEVDESRLQDYLERLIRNINEQVRHSNTAIDVNEGSAILSEGSLADLPEAEKKLQGRLYLATQDGSLDVLYVCRKTAADLYEWKEVSLI